MALRDAILAAVFDDLKDRSGFDHWWDNIDHDIKLEILTELGDKVEAVLEESGVG